MCACVCVCTGGIIVCNSLLRPELPAAGVSNNSECCRLTQSNTHKHTSQDDASSCLKTVKSSVRVCEEITCREHNQLSKLVINVM